MTLAPGTVLAGYTIERVLGAGGMGTVYLARHRTLPRSDALKVLSAELSRDPEFRARFIREADLAATLSHPNIVTVHDRGETADGQLWIAMQFVDGTDANAEAEGNGMPAQRAVHIIGEVAKALDYAHSRKVLHRDIKPANFLLSGAPGDHERVLLADFGIARARDEISGLTATGALVATASYAAPEAIEGRELDHRADLYSLGCSLFRLLTGVTPYGHLTGMSAVMMAHVLQPVPRVSDRAPWLPPAMDAVIAKAMAKDPAERFQSAQALASAAAAALAGHPPAAVPASPGGAPAGDVPAAITYPSGHFMPPPPGQLGTPPRVPSGPTPPPQRGRRRLVLGALAAVVLLAVAAVTTVLLVGRGDRQPAYQPQTFAGVMGTTSVDQRPHAVAALGPGDADAVLSLGVQPVVLTAPQGQLPSFEKDLAHANPVVLASVDPTAVAAAKPDVIIDTGDLDQASYAKLAAIAPTITRPADAGDDWNWQQQLTWIGRVLGQDDTAKSVVADAAQQQTQVKTEHANFGGKTVTVLYYSGTDTTVALRSSPPTRYLEGIGFGYNTKFVRGTGESDRRTLAVKDQYYAFSSDVVLVVRTDKDAGSGGLSGLPLEFRAQNTLLIAIDNPATIAALDAGGPAATSFLNTELVETLAAQLH